MNKISSIFAMAAVFMAAATSCSKDSTEPGDNNPANREVKFNITVTDFNQETRSVKTGWTNGDKLNIWFNDNQQKTPDLILTFDGNAWNQSSLRDPGMTFTNGKDCMFIYEGFNDLDSYDISYSQFTHNVTKGGRSIPQTNLTVIGFSTYNYNSEDQTVTTTLGSSFMLCPTRVQITVTGLDNAHPDNYSLSCNQLYSLDEFGFNGEGSGIMGGATVGVSNPDGIAFFFKQSKALQAADYAFTLTDYANNVTKTFTATQKTISQSNGKCAGIKIPSSKFTAVQ